MKFVLELTIQLLCWLPLVATAQDLGKIWIEDQCLYVNIPEEGLLIFDNTDAYEPKEIGYLPIPENHEMAVADGILYANHYEDLITIDIRAYLAGGGAQCAVVARMPGAFPKYRTTEQRIGVCNALPSSNALLSPQGGSMSSMAFDDAQDPNYLYVVHDRSLLVFRIGEARGSLQRVGDQVRVDDAVETIFAAGDQLYLGAQSGLHIFSIAQREKPVQVGRYVHVQSCDPVVVENGIAYVTLHDGSRCGRTVNELQIIDVSNPRSPRLLSRHSMEHPHGLGVDNKRVFLADGNAGLKVFNATTPGRLLPLMTDTAIHGAYDLILIPGVRRLILVAGNQVIQYAYNNITGSLTRLSEILVEY
ncbi:MAG: hypothetical protein KDC44_03360 [Phaeodactylibacter sp.]|nr:hypothetical protein [Phaeodactylibacter sp.]